MVQVQTMRFGTLEDLEVTDEAIITFPDGIPGFEEYTEYALIEEARFWPFAWLQPITEPQIGFVLMEPRLFVADYDPDFSCQDLTCLNVDGEDAVDLRCILVVPSDPKAATANIKAPLLINRRGQRGKQVILMDERFALRYPVFTDVTTASLEMAASCSS